MRLQLILLLLYSVNVFAVQKCKKDLLKTTFRSNDNFDVDVLLIWYPVEVGSLHTMKELCSGETGLPVHRFCSYDRSSTTGKWTEMSGNILNCSKIDNTCREETFNHYYILRNGLVRNHINKWKPTKLQEVGNLRDPCLLETGLPVTRKCLYNPSAYRAEWEPLTGSLHEPYCLLDTVEKVVTYNLSSLYNKVEEEKKEDNVNGKETADQMTEILTTPEIVRVPADIKWSSDILKIITEHDNKTDLVQEVINVTSIIMGTNASILAKSEELNATSSLLQTIDNYFEKVSESVVPTRNCTHIQDGAVVGESEGFTVFFINPHCSNISGVALYSKGSQQHDAHGNRKDYRYLYFNESLEELLNEPHLRLAAYFPPTLWENLKTKTAAVNNETVVIFKVYRNDSLFNNKTEMALQPARRDMVLDITLPYYSGELPEDLPFVISNKLLLENPKEKPRCGYWNKNSWVTTGIKTAYKNNGKFIYCYSSHLSHFASLLGASRNNTLEGNLLQTIYIVLDYISIAGCLSSLFGLICIWLTAIVFKSWRSQSSNKVLLNMTLVLTMIMVIYLYHNIPDKFREKIFDIKKELPCTIIGGFLQYAILVLFTWMFIIAIMQYQRYVQVFVERSSKFITMCALIAWGVPVIPTGLVIYLDRDTYMPDSDAIRNNTAICFPRKPSLYFGVILPVGAILLANLALFIYIFWSLHRSLIKFKSKRNKKNIIVELRLSVLLFFLLGISWIFGMLAHFSLICNYIFCLTSTLQGFVLFLYSIVIDESTRYSWITCCCAKNYYTRERF